MSPAPGTKRIEIAGEVHFLPAEEVEFARLAARGFALQTTLEQVAGELAEVKEQIVALVEPHRGERRSLKQRGPNGFVAHVKWASETSVDPDAALLAQAAIATEHDVLAAGLFTKVVSWKLGPGWNGFVKGRHSPKIEQLKPLVLAAVQSTPQKPRIKFFCELEGAPPAAETEDA